MTTSETEPAAAAELLGDRIDLLRKFCRNLVTHGEQRGLIGPLEPARIWTRHLLNCALVAPVLRPGRVGDIGSGGGLPGLVLAIARPDVQFTLVEPMERRTVWLEEQVADLQLENVAVLRARAEDVNPADAQFDQVTARAVSALKTLIPLVAPLVRPGGELVLLKGASVAQEIAAAQKQLNKFRVTRPEVLLLGAGVVREETRLFRATVGE